MNRVEGKVALITGAARGQGRSHAKRLAEEGADIVALDICADIPGVEYPLATPADLEETVRLVEAEDRRILARQVDVRDQAAIDQTVAEALAEFGHIDVVCANAGVAKLGRLWEITEQDWDDSLEIMLKGAWRTVRAVVPSMIEADRGGSIVLVSSLAGLKGLPNFGPYSASKFGLVGMSQSLAAELAEHRIRVNTVHPTNVDTGMIQNDLIKGVFRPDLDRIPTEAEFAEASQTMNVMPIPWVDPIDVSNAVLWLASDEARYVTGLRMTIDGGASFK